MNEIKSVMSGGVFAEIERDRETRQVWIRYYHLHPGRSETQEYFSDFAHMLNEDASPHRRLVLVFDLSALTLEMRDIPGIVGLLNTHSEFMRLYRGRTDSVIDGAVAVMSSPALRFVVDGLLQAIGGSKPVRFAKSVADVPSLAESLRPTSLVVA
jgi:hypothetical protein